MRGKHGVVQVVVVVVHLRRRQLTLVDDRLRRERTDVESALELELVRRLLAEDVQLALEVLLVERDAIGRIGGARALGHAVERLLALGAVVALEDDKRLQRERLARERRRSEDRVVGRDVPPSEDAESELVGDAGKRRLLLLDAGVVVPVGRARLAEKVVADGVLALLRQLVADLALAFADKERVRHADHDAGTVTVARVGTGRASVGHVACGW